LSNPDGLTQTNASTGKVRRLRIFDAAAAAAMTTSRGRIAIEESRRQQEFGPQSQRGGAPQGQLDVLEFNSHAKSCFERFAAKEKELCGEWAVFYHAYSFAALIYELHAAVGSLLFQFDAAQASLPRLLMDGFGDIPDAPTLIRKYKHEYAHTTRDHHPDYRKVCISAMCSLVALGPEVSPPVFFVAGYSCDDLSFRKVLEHLLVSCYVPLDKIQHLANEIILLSERYSLDVSQYGGAKCKSEKPGHMLQIFIRRDLLDQFAYASEPYGKPHQERQPVSRWLGEDMKTHWGQARIVAHPKIFMQPDCVRMYVESADPFFHQNRSKFQSELTTLLETILSEPSLLEHATTGINGGTLPIWWSAEDTEAAMPRRGLRDYLFCQRRPCTS